MPAMFKTIYDTAAADTFEFGAVEPIKSADGEHYSLWAVDVDEANEVHWCYVNHDAHGEWHTPVEHADVEGLGLELEPESHLFNVSMFDHSGDDLSEELGDYPDYDDSTDRFYETDQVW